MGNECSIEKRKSAQKRRRRSRANFARPQCEQLEERLALALFTVQQPLSFTGLNNNNNVAVADLNKDGLSDAILTNFGTDYGTGAGSTITLLYGKATGGFNRINLNTGGQNVSYVSIADINGDTWPDAVVTNQNHLNTGTVSVFRNDGAGNLALSGTPFSTFSYGPSWVGLNDVSGDGILDAIVSSDGKDNGAGGIVGNNVTIFQGNADLQGHGNFTFSGNPITTLAPSSQFAPASVAIADFDGDGLKDIAAAVPSSPLFFGQPQQEGSIYIFRGTGAGGFAAPTQFASGGAVPVDLHAANLNGDAKPDLLVANAGDSNANPEFKGNAVGVLLNASSGPGNVGFGTASLIDNTHGTFAVAAEDFNLDGNIDIAAVNYGGVFGPPNAFVSIHMGNGTGTFTTGSPATYDTKTTGSGGQYLAVGDFDSNGTPDLIVAHASNLVGLLLNTSVRPKVVGSEFIYQTSPQRLTFTFDQDVSASLGLNDIKIERLGGGTITPTNPTFDTNTKTWTVNFTGILADGNYRATLDASGINNSSGARLAANYVLDFFFLKGDLNHDRQVSIADFITLASNFNKSPAIYTDGDLNYDGTVSISDFIDLASNFNASLPQPTAAVAPQASAADSISSSNDTIHPTRQSPLSSKRPGHRHRHRFQHH